MYKIYSLSSENLPDIRNAASNHGIKLLSMDKKGNIFILFTAISIAADMRE